MGEIGITHETFMHELCWWQIKAIIAGHRRAQENTLWWKRLYAWMQLLPNTGEDSPLRESPESLHPLPHDKPRETGQPTKEEVERLREEMRRHNEALASKGKRECKPRQ